MKRSVLICGWVVSCGWLATLAAQESTTNSKALVGRNRPKQITSTTWTEPAWRLPRIDEAAYSSVGIRKIVGRHLTLYTDLRPVAEVDELPVVFDLAVPQWCAYFKIDPDTLQNWHMVGYLIQDKARFEKVRALRPDTPKFLNGFQLESELWLYDQPTAYYRRHLLLHEGVHGFMNWRLGGCGPPWYMEGMAELLASHEWVGGRLRLPYFPPSREAVPGWGRIKIIKDETQDGRPMTLEQIFRYDNRAHLRVQPYGWCWGAAAFFNAHPRWRAAFNELPPNAGDTGFEFSQRFIDRFAADWPAVCREWQLFIEQIEYGYDVARMAIDPKPSKPWTPADRNTFVAADRGWQSTGIGLTANKPYRLMASGRFQLGQTPKPWWCEANGITIRYYRGLPLGSLIATVVDETAKTGNAASLSSPTMIGYQRTLTPKHSGTLYLRLNDSPAELADNVGGVDVLVDAE